MSRIVEPTVILLLLVATLTDGFSAHPFTRVQNDLYTCWQDICNMKRFPEFCSVDRKSCMSCLDVEHDCGSAKMQPNCTRFCFEELVKQEKEKGCQRLPNITNGVHNGSGIGNIRYGDVVIATCHSGYEMVGGEKIQCSDYGHFDTSLPICIERMVYFEWKVAAIVLLCVCSVLLIILFAALYIRMKSSKHEICNKHIEKGLEDKLPVCHKEVQASLDHLVTLEVVADSPSACRREISNNVLWGSRTIISQPEQIIEINNSCRDGDLESTSVKVPHRRDPTLEQSGCRPVAQGLIKKTGLIDKMPVQCKDVSNGTARIATTNCSNGINDKNVAQNTESTCEETHPLLHHNGGQFGHKLELRPNQNVAHLVRQLSNG